MTHPQAWSGWLESTEVVALGSAPRLHFTMPSLSMGKIRDVPVARLLYLMTIQRRSGVLSLSNAENVQCRVELSHGQPRAEPERALDLTQSAFAWQRGDYRLEEGELSGHPTVTSMPFLYDGIVRSLSFNDIALTLAPHSEHYLAYTTLLEERRDELMQIQAPVLEVLENFNGTRTLTTCLGQLDVAPETLFHAVSFGLTTDLVALFPEPVKPPVGISYKLRERGEGEGIERNTMFEIARLDRGDQTLLEKLRQQHEDFTQRDPYALLGLFRGCGASAVQLAYFNLLNAYHPGKFELYEGTPIKVVAELIFGLVRDSYQLVLAWERGEALATPLQSESAGVLLDELEEAQSEEDAALIDDLQRLSELPSHMRVGRGADESETRKLQLDSAKDPVCLPTTNAADDFERGLDHLEREELYNALKAFISASDKAPRHGRYRAYVAWCSYCCRPDRAEQVLDTLKQVEGLELGGRIWARIFRARILSEQGHSEEAQEILQGLRERYPGMAEIRRELNKLSS